MRPALKQVKAIEKYKLFVKFEDGIEGTLDLSDLAGREVFKIWEKDNIFFDVFISDESGAITWPGEIDIDTFNAYCTIKGVNPEDFFKEAQSGYSPLGDGGKKVLFIDRDGTMIQEYPPTYQIDAFEKVTFYPFVFKYLGKIAAELNYELVVVSNQDGLGTDKFPEEDFWPVHNLIMSSFANEGVVFKEELIDRSYPKDNLDTRKPGIGMFTQYLNNPAYDIPNSFVIGDRITDVQLAKNLGCQAIWLNNNPDLGGAEVKDSIEELQTTIVLETQDWQAIYEFLKLGKREIKHVRKTNETEINIKLNLDGGGKANIKTGLGFFDHMLEQIARHGLIDLSILANGDLNIDEHHTIEDTGITLGEAFAKAIGDKKGIERYGFALPMDEAEAKVLIDFGGRNWIVWNADFSRDKVGDMPVELFFHFFKSFSDAAKCNLNIECRGENEHHKIEAIFKAFAKAIKMAVKRDPLKNYLPSTKGLL